MRNALLLLHTPEHATSLLVTSPESGDGKSLISANLALSLAHAGRSVLLIDAHFAIPGFIRFSDAVNRQGWENSSNKSSIPTKS